MSAFSRRMTAWSVGAFDFENDGWKDLFTSGGAILDNELEVLRCPSPKLNPPQNRICN
ncbi:MAG: hypothetical protein ACLPZY_03680 [Terracidiphilus sp.]